jgi:ABC-2 type transport system ATP-binding protein
VALAGLDLHVAAGETVALLGPNGAGKTTTIGLLLGLLSPGRGQVLVCGRPPSRAVAGGLAGAMLQDAGLMPGVRVGELLAMVRGLYPRPLPVDELAGLADLGSLLGRRADRLSGGQAQRVRFAVAIAGDPLLLVLDEPTSAMDVHARRNFWRQIHAFAGRGRTVLFATHYLQDADDAADRVVVIKAGRKIADGSPAAIKANYGDRQVRFTLAVFSATGPRISHERAIGWTRQLRVTPLSPAAAVSGKLVTALAAALPAMALVALTAVVSHHVQLSAAQWPALLAAMWAGVLPLALLGLAIGYLAGDEIAFPLTMALYFALGALSGLAIPPSTMPHAMQGLGQALPSNGVAELGWRIAGGQASVPKAVLVLTAWLLGSATAALLAYRRRNIRSAR